ncbi:hypothetical protein ACTOJ1_000937 [Shigella flexneri]
MFMVKKEAKDIQELAYEAGMNAYKYHANVRQSIVLAYRSEGINPTNETVNTLAEKINKEGFNQRHIYSNNGALRSKIWAM